MAKSVYKHILNSKSSGKNLVIYTDGIVINKEIRAVDVKLGFICNLVLGLAESFIVYSAEI